MQLLQVDPSLQVSHPVIQPKRKLRIYSNTVYFTGTRAGACGGILGNGTITAACRASRGVFIHRTYCASVCKIFIITSRAAITSCRDGTSITACN